MEFIKSCLIIFLPLWLIGSTLACGIIYQCMDEIKEEAPKVVIWVMYAVAIFTGWFIVGMLLGKNINTKN